jgi:hypothetical protein
MEFSFLESPWLMYDQYNPSAFHPLTHAGGCPQPIIPWITIEK